MLRRAAIVSAFAATLAMPLLSGCGIRGPLTMPRVPPAPAEPTVPDPGLGNPSAPMPTSAPSATSPDTPDESSGPASTPSSGNTPAPR